MTRSAARLVGPGLLAGLALIGPHLAGPADAPSVAPSAAQLLPPGARVQQVALAGGGYARALEVETVGDGLRLRSRGGWRELPGIRAAERVRDLRLWLGSDHQGRSILARLLHGARTSLVVASTATMLAVLIGAALGIASTLASPLGRGVTEVGTDGLLGLPRLLLLLMLGVMLRGSSLGIAVAIGLGSWMELARLAQAESTKLNAMPFVLAARASGAGGLRLALRHLLPNLTPILAVAAPLIATEAILLEATLSFLGVAGESAASWGSIVADGQRLLPKAWWMTVFPGLLLCVAALAVHGLARPHRPRRFSSP